MTGISSDTAKAIATPVPTEPIGPATPTHVPRAAGRAPGASVAWLAGAMAGLAVLAAAAAAVSWDAQYVMVARARPIPAIAALEAGIPDTGAAVFAALGIALALHGRRALRPRARNVGCVGLSVAMNALAAAPGWRNVAIWVMPSAVYALASDTLIGVVRSWAIARMREHEGVGVIAAATGRRGLPHGGEAAPGITAPAVLAGRCPPRAAAPAQRAGHLRDARLAGCLVPCAALMAPGCLLRGRAR